MSAPTARSRRWGAWSALAAIIVVIAVLWFAPRMVDWSPYKSNVADLISEQLGVDVDLRGGLQIVLLPQPRITIADIRIDGVTAQGKVRWLRGSLDPRGLLSGRLVPRDIELVEADLRLPITPEIGQNYNASTTVTIQDGRLILTGGPSWIPNRLNRINGRLALGGRPGHLFAFDGEARLLDEPVGISVEGRSDGRMVLAIAHGPSASDIALEGGRTEGGGWSGRATLVLEETGFLSTLQAEAITRLIGEGHATLDTAIDVSPAGVMSVSVDRLSSTRLSGTGTTTLVPGPRPAFNLALALDRVAMADNPPSIRSMVRDAARALEGFAEIDITIRLDADLIESAAGPLRKVQISAAAGGGIAVIDNASAILPGGLNVSLFGSARPMDDGWAIDGETAILGPDFRTTFLAILPEASDFAASLPQDRFRAIDMSARIFADKNGVEITELFGRLDETSLAGAISARPDGSLEVLIEGDRINTDRYFGHPVGSFDPAAAILEALATLPGDTSHRISLYFDQAAISGMPVRGAGLDVNVDAGTAVTGTVTAASIAGASGRGDFTIDLANPAETGRVSVKLDIPSPDRFLGALGIAARQAAQAAAFGETSLILDLSASSTGGFGYAFEALGSYGDARLSGVFHPGPLWSLDATNGALNLGDLSIFQLSGQCDSGGDEQWACRNLTAEMAGLRIAGTVDAASSSANVRQIRLAVDAADMDLGLFASHSGLPILPEGTATLSGGLTGHGANYVAAAADMAGTLSMTGKATLRLRPGGGGRFGNLDTLRAHLNDTFGDPGRLSGTLTIAPRSFRTDLALHGADAILNGHADVSLSDGTMDATLNIVRQGSGESLLTLSADGPVEGPGLKLKGPWVTGR